MAIQSNYTDINTGITINNAYIDIHNFSGTKQLLNFTIEVFSSKPTENNNIQPFAFNTYTIPTNQVTGADSLYNFLLIQPEFENAIIVE